MKTQKDLLYLIEKKCNKNGIKIDLRETKYVIYGKHRCLGYFDPHFNTIVVAKNSSENYISTLVHEYCHSLQYLDDKRGFLSKITSIDAINEWVCGVEKKNIKKHINQIKNLELDNELRTVKLLKKYKTNIDLTDYIKTANCIIMSYDVLKKTRKYKFNMIDNWYDKMPSKLNAKYKKHKKLFCE